mmetsp:Transcript_13933/g.33246  ORF Transcript_13933/g.33246 Transcript_13933/m.33246 type:complete len:205 (+) Transcript_13933:318-932(+)
MAILQRPQRPSGAVAGPGGLLSLLPRLIERLLRCFVAHLEISQFPVDLANDVEDGRVLRRWSCTDAGTQVYQFSQVIERILKITGVVLENAKSMKNRAKTQFGLEVIWFHIVSRLCNVQGKLKLSRCIPFHSQLLRCSANVDEKLMNAWVIFPELREHYLHAFLEAARSVRRLAHFGIQPSAVLERHGFPQLVADGRPHPPCCP